MGSFNNFDSVCRLCGLECYDLINLFEQNSQQRNLTFIIKKYLRVTVVVQDSLPHHVCGACVAKLDEVVDFVDRSQATQGKLNSQLTESTRGVSVEVKDDKLYELIQDVKVELEESHDHFVDDVNDEDYGPHTNRKKRRNTTRGTRGRGIIFRGLSSEQPKKRSKEETQEIDNNKEEERTPNKTNEQLMGRAVKCAVRCGVCKSPFSHLDHLSSHSLEVHELTEPSYLCPQCPQVFNKITSLKNHHRRKHQESVQMCPECNKLYPSHYLWTRHMLVHTNSRPFSCDKCDKKFKSKSELINHKKIHRPSEERYTHCCEVCGKRFTQKANLESHLRLHNGHRPFSCEFCGKCFSQRGNMEEHRRIHTGEKPFVCDVCGVRYSRQGQLTMHRKQHSGEKPYRCQYCDKEFLRREVLKKHEHVHTDTRPYKCSYCEKSFRDQGKRKVHERLHTGERPYKCNLCGRGFCESGNLRKHLRVHPPSLSSASIQNRDQSLPPDTGTRETSNRESSPSPNTVASLPRVTTLSSSINVSVLRDSSTLAMSEPVNAVSVNRQTISLPHQDSKSSTQPQEHSQPHEKDPTNPPRYNPTPPQHHPNPSHPQRSKQFSTHPSQPHRNQSKPHHNTSIPPQPQISSSHPSTHTLPVPTIDDSQGSSSLSPQDCSRQDYRVSYHPSGWNIYHA